MGAAACILLFHTVKNATGWVSVLFILGMVGTFGEELDYGLRIF